MKLDQYSIRKNSEDNDIAFKWLFDSPDKVMNIHLIKEIFPYLIIIVNNNSILSKNYFIYKNCLLLVR